MKQNIRQRLLASLIAIIVGLSVWSIAPTAQAYNNPDLLPDHPVPIIDLAKSLTGTQQQVLIENLTKFEQKTGWKLRVLTQYDRTPGQAVRKFWGLDDKSILLVADQRGGNLLNFNVGMGAYKYMPRTFWIELQTRFGNLYFVRENGEDQAILQSIETIETCIERGGCKVVPGLPKEQWILTLVTSVLGGIIAGFASIPRKSEEIFAWKWTLIFSPLWGILFIAFGMLPVITRTTEWLPILRNISGFVMGALVAYLSPLINQSVNSQDS